MSLLDLSLAVVNHPLVINAHPTLVETVKHIQSRPLVKCLSVVTEVNAVLQSKTKLEKELSNDASDEGYLGQAKKALCVAKLGTTIAVKTAYVVGVCSGLQMGTAVGYLAEVSKVAATAHNTVINLTEDTSELSHYQRFSHAVDTVYGVCNLTAKALVVVSMITPVGSTIGTTIAITNQMCNLTSTIKLGIAVVNLATKIFGK